MEVYIDKENLRSFIHARKDPQYSDCYDDCYRMLKRQLHINYNFAKTKELIEDEDLRSYFMMSMQGNGESEADTYVTEMFPTRPVKANTANEFDKKQRSAVYLIDDEKAKLVIDKGALLIGESGKEMATLNRLFCGRDYEFHKLYNIQNRNSFTGWEQLKQDQLNLPLSDIILMDRYLGTDVDLAPYNIFKLLDVLVDGVHDKVNVVLLCSKEYYNKNDRRAYSPDWDKFRRDIKDRLKRKTGFGCNVTLVFYTQDNNPHDRTILTNYMLFRSGDSFCYYNSKGEMISKGNSLDVDSLAKKSNFDYAMSFIEMVQNLCDKIHGLNPDNIFGDKKSNYINFQ